MAETAPAEVRTEIEKVLNTFLLNIEGVFNHISVENIYQGARDHDISDKVERWVWRWLDSRRVVAEWKQCR